MITGIEQAAIAIARQSWENAREDMPHLRDIMAGKVPANDVYVVKLIESVHQEFIKANRLSLDLFLAQYREEA